MIQVHQDTTETAINASKVVAVVKDIDSSMVTVKTDGEDFEFEPCDEDSLEQLYQAILSELSAALCP